MTGYYYWFSVLGAKTILWRKCSITFFRFIWIFYNMCTGAIHINWIVQLTKCPSITSRFHPSLSRGLIKMTVCFIDLICRFTIHLHGALQVTGNRINPTRRSDWYCFSNQAKTNILQREFILIITLKPSPAIHFVNRVFYLWSFYRM